MRKNIGLVRRAGEEKRIDSNNIHLRLTSSGGLTNEYSGHPPQGFHSEICLGSSHIYHFGNHCCTIFLFKKY